MRPKHSKLTARSIDKILEIKQYQRNRLEFFDRISDNFDNVIECFENVKLSFGVDIPEYTNQVNSEIVRYAKLKGEFTTLTESLIFQLNNDEVKDSAAIEKDKANIDRIEVELDKFTDICTGIFRRYMKEPRLQGLDLHISIVEEI